jgi:hypothetical protein
MKFPLMFPADAVAPAAPQPPVVPISSLPPVQPRAAAPAAFNSSTLEAGLDEMFDKKVAPVPEPATAPAAPAPAPVAPAAKEPEAPVDEDKPFVDDMLDDEPEAKAPEAKPDTKPTEAPKDQPKPDQIPSFKTPKEMRQHLKEVNREKFGLIERNARLTKENEELKKNGGSSAEVKALAEQLANEQKARQQLEERLGGYDFASTTEFQTKYQEPLKQAVNRASQFIPQLEVNVVDANGEPSVRPATWSDFQSLYSLPPGKVDKAAHEMFGHAAPRVIQHLDRIKELGEIADNAQKNATNLAKEQQQKATAEQAQVREIQLRSFQQSTKALTEKYPEFFGESEDDAEGTELLRKGLAWADQLFSGKANALPPEKRAQMDATLRLRAAGFSRVAAQLSKTKAELAKAKAELESIRSTKPKIGAENGSPAPVKNEADIFSGIDSIPSFNR